MGKTSRAFRQGLMSALGSLGLTIFFANPMALHSQERFGSNMADRGNARGILSLESQLSMGLRAFNDDQRAFISRVLTLVEQKRVSRAMVNTIYAWALRMNPEVPFPYFEHAFRAIAKRRGISIPT